MKGNEARSYSQLELLPQTADLTLAGLVLAAAQASSSPDAIPASGVRWVGGGAVPRRRPAQARSPSSLQPPMASLESVEPSGKTSLFRAGRPRGAPLAPGRDERVNTGGRPGEVV